MASDSEFGAPTHNTDGSCTGFYSWGANSYGQLAQDDRVDRLLPQNATLPCNPRYITGGGGHTLIIDENGSLFACGSNDKGQLGLGSTSDMAALQRVPLGEQIVSKVCGGWDFTVALTEMGSVLSWGSNTFGQLGRSGVKMATKPVLLTFPSGETITDIAAGLRHAIALSASGSIFTWGSGKKGQLGVEVEGQAVASSMEPMNVKFPRDVKIIQVVAGSYHSAAQTATGEIFIWGCNKFGQSTISPGVMSQVNVPYSVPTDLFQNRVITMLNSGWTHLLAQTDTGQVYTWGRGDYGQLGRSCNAQCEPRPLPVDGLQQVEYLACGSEHNLVVNADGSLWSWGWNEHGMCGNGKTENIMIPQKITTLDERLFLIGCGAGHSLAVTNRKHPNTSENQYTG